MNIEQGARIRVPAGADLTRSRTYTGTVLEIYSDANDGFQTLRIQRPGGAKMAAIVRVDEVTPV